MVKQKLIKHMSRFMATAFVFGCMGTPVLAAEHTTAVTFVGTGVEAYEVTVPAALTPGDSDSVDVIGTWPETKKLTVAAPENVTLTCDLNGATQILDVSFENIEQIGSNTDELNVSSNIQIAEMPSNILFGTWEGTINYSVSLEEIEDEAHVCSYGDWNVTKEATCTETGIKERTCECGDIETETIDTIDHSYAYAICTECGAEEVSGLYDVDGNLLATWDELGVNVNGVWTPMPQRNDYYGSDSTHASNILYQYPNAARLVVSHDIDSIAGYAFAGCDNYTIVVPSTVTTIGANAFANGTHYQYNGSAVIE